MRVLLAAAFALLMTTPAMATGLNFGDKTYNQPKAYGGDAEAAALAGAKSKSVGIQDTTVKTRVGVKNDIDLTSKQKTRVDQDNDQTLVGLQGQKTVQKDGDITIGGDDTKNKTTILNISPAALSNLPVANCQGASHSASLNGAVAPVGGGVAWGSSEESEQCNRRENLRMAVTLGLITKEEAKTALAGLLGLEHLAPKDEAAEVAVRPVSAGDGYVYGRD